jgi:ribosomal protein L29
LENPLGIKVLRRENAQIKTVLREFDLGLRTERSEK